jgi:hypothetical protein
MRSFGLLRLPRMLPFSNIPSTAKRKCGKWRFTMSLPGIFKD